MMNHMFAHLSEQQIFRKANKKKIVISDETLCDLPQLYFAPYVLPRDVIAARLFRLFSPAKIVFTIRNQEHYVASMYLNLKRNSAIFSRAPIIPLSRWYRGMLSQYRCFDLQNLNFAEVIFSVRKVVREGEHSRVASGVPNARWLTNVPPEAVQFCRSDAYRGGGGSICTTTKRENVVVERIK